MRGEAGGSRIVWWRFTIRHTLSIVSKPDRQHMTSMLTPRVKLLTTGHHERPQQPLMAQLFVTFSWSCQSPVLINCHVWLPVKTCRLEHIVAEKYPCRGLAWFILGWRCEMQVAAATLNCTFTSGKCRYWCSSSWLFKPFSEISYIKPLFKFQSLGIAGSQLNWKMVVKNISGIAKWLSICQGLCGLRFSTG